MSDVVAIEAALRSGGFLEAENACRAHLGDQPDSPEVLSLLAVSLEHQERFEEAVAAMERSHQLAGMSARHHFDLGRLYLSLEEQARDGGELYEPFVFQFPWGQVPFPVRAGFPEPKRPKAIAHLRDCLALDPNHARACGLLGLTLVDAPETLAEGAALIQQALNANPGDPLPHFGIAKVAFIQAQFEIAEQAFGGALKLDPANVRAKLFRALTQQIRAGSTTLEFLSDAADKDLISVAELMRMLMIHGAQAAPQAPAIAEIARNVSLGLATYASRKIDETGAFISCARLIDAAARLTPNLPEASEALGRLFLRSTGFTQAQAAFEWAMAAGMDAPEVAEKAALASVMNGYHRTGALDLEGVADEHLPSISRAFLSASDIPAGEAVLRKLHELLPDDITAGIELAQAMYCQGRLEEALEVVTRLETVAPDSPEIHMELWYINMSLGRSEIAWPYYESRLNMHRNATPRSAPPLPKWDGGDIGDKRLLVWPEEGIGDQMRYSSCFPDVHERLGDRAVFEITPRLLPLLRQSYPGLNIKAEDPGATDFSDFDYHVPMCSLLGMFRHTLVDFPAEGDFIKADEDRVAAWSRRLAELGDGPAIGLGWRSSNPSWAKLFFNARLSELRPILDIPGARLINLQIGDYLDEISAVEAVTGITIHSFDDLDVKNDFEEVAALISALDFVVAARCWVLTFAGAVGTTAHGFSTPPNPFMFGRDYDPWSPTTRIHDRRFGEPWESTMRGIAAAIMNAVP